MKLQWFSLLYSRAMWTEMKVTLTLLMLKVCRKCDCFTTVYVTIWIMWPVYNSTIDRWTQSEASLHIPQVAETSLKSQLRSRFTVDWLLHDLRLPFPHKRTPGLRRSSTHCIQRQTVHVRFKNNCFWSSVVLSPVLMNSKLPFYRLPDSNTKLLSVCWTILMKFQCLDVC